MSLCACSKRQYIYLFNGSQDCSSAVQGAAGEPQPTAAEAAGAAVDDAMSSTRTAQLASLAEQADIRRSSAAYLPAFPCSEHAQSTLF